VTRRPGSDAELARLVRSYIDTLCLPFPDRRVGSPGNAAANAWFADAAAGLGCSVERIGFDCVDWEFEGATLQASGRAFEVLPSPYSRPFEGSAPLVAAADVDALESLDARGAVLLLHGDVTKHQLTPKNYPFYRFDEHTRILAAIEEAAPLAVVAATGRDPQMTGALYPFPLFEDADFEIPSVYMKDVDGDALLESGGDQVSIEIDSRPVPSRAEQVIARIPGSGEGRVVVSAHIDSRVGTPGALDNAAGVAVLLVLAELLQASSVTTTVEVVPFNGEDDYAAPGEMAYIEANGAAFEDVLVAINIDAAAWVGHRSAVSVYGLPDDLASLVGRMVARARGLVEGPAWPQSDHMIFAMRKVPAMAVTSEDVADVTAGIAHTEHDLPELVDAAAAVEIARFIQGLIADLR
jgi:aminopeptidase YwaD